MSPATTLRHDHEGRGRGSGAGADLRRRLLEGLPVTQHRLQVAGVSTLVLEGGAGPSLVLLHGGIECGGAYWAPIVARLAERHRLIVPDVPGLGASDPVARLDGATFGGWFSELLRLTCDAGPALVAHSLLGSLSSQFAAAGRGLLSRLVIYGAPGVGRYRMPPGLALAAMRFDLSPSRASAERFERWVFLDRERVMAQDPEWFDAFEVYCLDRARVRHVKRTMRQLVRAGTKRVPEKDLRRIDLPTALVWGRYDRMTPLRLAREANTTLGWPLLVVEDAGHAPHLERPDAFVTALEAALEIR